jgi:hypothetical protein
MTTRRSTADIVREYGPFPGADHVAGVTYDGQHVWFAAGDTLARSIPRWKTVRSIASLRMPERRSTAGTCSFRRGSHQKMIRSRPCSPRSAPAARRLGTYGPKGALGGQYRDRKIHQVDPRPARFSTIESIVVTGVTWVDGAVAAMGRRRGD